MDSREATLTMHLKAHDPALYAQREAGGMMQIYRKGTAWDVYELDGNVLRCSRPNPQFILAVTHDWTLKGNPVEWGIEPILWKIKEMDCWRDDQQFQKMREDRERRAEDKKRQQTNEFVARAADMRRDFARSTNDINTASLNKKLADRRK